MSKLHQKETCTGSVSRIKLWKWDYSEWCLRDVLEKLEIHTCPNVSIYVAFLNELHEGG